MIVVHHTTADGLFVVTSDWQMLPIVQYLDDEDEACDAADAVAAVVELGDGWQQVTGFPVSSETMH